MTGTLQGQILLIQSFVSKYHPYRKPRIFSMPLTFWDFVTIVSMLTITKLNSKNKIQIAGGPQSTWRRHVMMTRKRMEYSVRLSVGCSSRRVSVHTLFIMTIANIALAFRQDLHNPTSNCWQQSSSELRSTLTVHNYKCIEQVPTKNFIKYSFTPYCGWMYWEAVIYEGNAPRTYTHEYWTLQTWSFQPGVSI